MIDHLVFATSDLERTVMALALRLGVRSVAGGQHVGFGTRNELVALGGGTYLEIVGPDLEQPRPVAPRPFGIDELTGEALVAWCARPDDELEAVVSAAEATGHRPGPISAMSRQRPDGTLLTWRLTLPQPQAPLGSVAPFLIDWGPSTHPTMSLPMPAVALERLVLGTPDPNQLSRLLAVVGHDERVEIETAAAISITAHLTTQVGTLRL